MSLFSNYLLYQLRTRYIGPISGCGNSELLPGSYLYIFGSQEFTDLENLLEGMRSRTTECEIIYSNSILDLSLKYGEQHELRCEEQSCELLDVEKYLEKRQGLKVFSDFEPLEFGKPLLYFFPKKLIKLKKLLPPNLGQLEQ